MKAYNILEDDTQLPRINEPVSVYISISSAFHDKALIQRLEDTIHIKDDIIADWLNITPRTYRNYKTKDATFKPNMREHIIMLLSLYEHGQDVFSNASGFEKWLSSPNVFLDNTAPKHFMNTINGIKMVDDRLTALEYGENV